MRNLKRALSLGLTAVMISGLMVMGSSAASYADVTSENNVEAIEVLESVGIMIGDESGNFNPDQNVTRNEMAVVMANLMEYNVASYKDTSPFTDVPSWAEPYVAACWTNGITSGYSDTIYGGSDDVTTAQAALMLMKALGYFQYSSDFGSDWQLATTRQGNAIDLFNGVDSGVTQAMTRNDVAQLVLNTLQAGTVQASTDGSWTIGDVTINNNVQYSYITSNQTYATAIDDARSTSNNSDAQRSIVELGEQLYQGDLKLNDNTDDDFMRPSRTWSYDGKEIGTYAKRELQIATYTTGVTGREMYDLLSASTIRDSELFNYVDGVAGTIEDTDLRRSNEKDLAATGNGVLTEVYLDQDRDEVTIVSINTWLAQANANYNQDSETLSLNVFESDSNGVTKVVDVEEVPEVADVVEDQFVLVNMSKKDNAQGEVVAIADPEILEDSTVTKFSQSGDDQHEGFFSKLTVDGTEYEAAEKAEYDDEVLNLYDATLLTDMSYNVYLDQYGYAIGVDLYEGEANYVFITGYDRGQSYISIKTADAAAIFTDGTMDAITVNVTDTNKNIDKLDGDNDNNNGDGEYYEPWNNAGDVALNRWYTYTVDGNDVYTLKPVEDRMLVSSYDFGGTDPEEVNINCTNVRLNDDYYSNGRAFGNDDSVYITVEAGNVDMSATGKDDAITEVSGLYTGVQDVDIELTEDLQADVAEGSVFTLKDKDDYIIASVVLGEAQGSTANYAFILSEAKSEGIDNGEYMWEFEAVMNGEKQTLTARSKYPSTISDLKKDNVQELRFDGDYVVGVKDISDSKIIDDYGIKWDDHEVYDVEYTGETLELKGRTLQSSGTDDEGLTIVSTSMPTVLGHEVNGEWETINYSSMAEALAAAGDKNPSAEGKQFDGRIVAVLNAQGVAQWAYIRSDVPVTTGSGTVSGGADGDYLSYSSRTYDSGYMTMDYTVEWPEWLSTGDSDDLAYAFDIMVNSSRYYTETGIFTTAGVDKSTSWNNNIGSVPLFFISPVEVNSKVTVENFRFTNLDEQTYLIKYEDQNGHEYAINSTNFNNPYTATTNGSILADVPMVMSHDLNAALFGGGTYGWSIEGVEDDPTDSTTTYLSRTGVTAGSPSNTGGRVQVVDGWMGYITVTINTSGMTQKYTVTGQAADALSDLVVGGYSGLGDSQTLSIQVDTVGGGSYGTTETVNDGDDVIVRARLNTALNAANGDAYGLELTLSTADPTTGKIIDEIGTVKLLNNNVNGSNSLTLSNVQENLEIVITEVKVLNAPRLLVDTITFTSANGDDKIDDNEVITFKFSENVTKVGTITLSNVDGETISGDTFIYTQNGSSDSSITITAGAVENADGVQNTKVTINIDLDSPDHFDVSYS